MAEAIRALVFLTIMLSLSLSPVVIGEEPFCNNKCHGRGVATSTACYCDVACSTLFNDCCGDSEHLVASFGGRAPYKRNLMTCRTIGKDRIFVIEKCPENWNGPGAIRESCQKYTDSEETTHNGSDPLSWIPVTSSDTGVTYGNYYCAVCNSELQKSVFWRIKVVCPSLHPNFLLDSDDIFSYLYYNRPTDSWGFTTRDGKGVETFHGCELKPAVSKQLSQVVRRCDSSEVDSCDVTWKKDVIKRMCGRYSDPVYANGTRYKNFYCAICNYEDQSGFSCGSAMGPRHDAVPEIISGEGPNFALLLDINFSQGNNVGKRKFPVECDNKEDVYDPFKRQCRNVVCGLPGYTLLNGHCIHNV